jgi:ABC-2 type transport system permease protein
LATAPVPTTIRAQRASGTRHILRILWVTATAEFKLKYQDSVLGYVWSLAKPLALFSMLYIVFGRFLAFNHDHFYALRLLLGIVIWFFFLDASVVGMASVTARGPLLRKLDFPRLTIPISITISSAMTLCVNMLAVAVFLAIRRITPHLDWLLVVPLLLELFVFVLGVALILGTVAVWFKDVSQVWELALQLVFYASPILYPPKFLPSWFRPITFLNPLVQVIEDLRRILVPPYPGWFSASTVYGGTAAGELVPIGIAVLTLAAGLALFQWRSPKIPERV